MLHERHTFPKSERLQYGWQFRQVLESGRCCRGRLLVVYSLRAAQEPRRVGIVSSRRVGNAVARNRARRLLREAYRLHKHQLLDHTQLVMIARAAIAKSKFREVEAEMLALWRAADVLAPV